MNYYNKYLKYKNKYLNFIMRGGTYIDLSFINSKDIIAEFKHNNNKIMQNELYSTEITYPGGGKYGYYYFFDENNDGVIFSKDFSKWFEIREKPN